MGRFILFLLSQIRHSVGAVRLRCAAPGAAGWPAARRAASRDDDHGPKPHRAPPAPTSPAPVPTPAPAAATTAPAKPPASSATAEVFRPAARLETRCLGRRSNQAGNADTCYIAGKGGARSFECTDARSEFTRAALEGHQGELACSPQLSLKNQVDDLLVQLRRISQRRGAGPHRRQRCARNMIR